METEEKSQDNFWTRTYPWLFKKKGVERVSYSEVKSQSVTLSGDNKIHRIGTTPQQLDLESDGYEKAKANNGSLEALKLHLSQIVEGKKVEKDSRIALNEQEKEAYKEKILELNNRIKKVESEIKDIDNNKIPSDETDIKTFKREIDEIVTDNNPQYLLGKTFNPTKFSITSFFLLLLSAYIFLFYVSAIHSAFFRNIEEELKNLESGAENLSLLLNSIFNPNVLFDSGNEIYILLLAPFLFFGFAYSVHLMYEGEPKRGYIGIALVAAITLFSDSLVAYKIDKSINDITSIIKLADTGWIWYKSVNFYIVLVMGFVSLIIWSIIFHALSKEIDKRDISKLRNKEIEIRNEKIDQFKTKIDAFKSSKTEKGAIIDECKNIIDYYTKLTSLNVITVETVLLSIDSFASGWVKLLNETRNTETIPKTQNCVELVKEVKERIVKSN